MPKRHSDIREIAGGTKLSRRQSEILASLADQGITITDGSRDEALHQYTESSANSPIAAKSRSSNSMLKTGQKLIKGLTRLFGGRGSAAQ